MSNGPYRTESKPGVEKKPSWWRAQPALIKACFVFLALSPAIWSGIAAGWGGDAVQAFFTVLAIYCALTSVAVVVCFIVHFDR